MAQAFQTSRWLRPYRSKSGRQVFIRVRMRNGADYNIPVYDYVNHEKLPISVKREYWNKGYVTGGNYHTTVRDINYLFSRVELAVKYAVEDLIEKNIKINQENIIQLTYINEINALENERKIASGEIIVDEQGGAFASQDEFVDFLEISNDPKFDKLKKSLGIYSKEYILDFWDDFIDNAPDSYNAPKHAIEEYIKVTEDNCKANEFSSAWLNRFFKHIIDNGYSWRNDGKDRLNYTITTINKYQKHLMKFGNYLFAVEKVLENQDYRRFGLKREVKKQSLVKYQPEAYINTHALYKREFDFFYNYEFKDKQLEMVRDMFILQTWAGGLRQSDFFNLTENNIYKDSNGDYRIVFEQQKTDNEVTHKINKDYLNPILAKYINNFKTFPRVHEYNKLLKKAAKEAGLNRKLRFRNEYANAAKPTEEWIEIHKRITNSWARNCAVSILTELGYEEYKITKFIGHKDPRMVKHYQQIHQKEIDSMIDAVKPEIVKEL